MFCFILFIFFLLFPFSLGIHIATYIPLDQLDFLSLLKLESMISNMSHCAHLYLFIFVIVYNNLSYQIPKIKVQIFKEHLYLVDFFYIL